MKFGCTIDQMKKQYPALTDELLDELQKWAQQRNLPTIPEEHLALFAYSCDYDVESATRCMNVYYKMRATTPEFFNDRDPESEYLQQNLKVLRFATLPVPDPNGNRIIFHRVDDPRPNQYIMSTAMKLYLMTFETECYTNGICPGVVLVFDMQRVELGHLLRISISCVRKFIRYVQEGLPIKLVGIHVMNTVWFINKIQTILKPLMKKEIYEMIHFYPNVSDIYTHIPPECLPKDYGGELDSVDTLHEQFCRKLVELKDYFLEEENRFRTYPVKNGKTSASNIQPVKKEESEGEEESV